MALNRISYPLFGLFLIVAISCKKENTVYPNISIAEPSAKSTFQYQDTIFLKVNISNLDGAVVVTLLKEGISTNVGFTQIYSTNGQRYFEAMLGDPNLLSGNYSIRVQAYNGENRSSEFLEIIYQEAELIRLGFACLLQDGVQRQLGLLPDNGSLSTISLSGDYPFLAVNSSLGFIYAAPAFSGKFSAFDTFLNMIYDVPNPVPSGSLQYHQLINSGQLTYALDNDRYIRAYRESNSPVRNYQLAQERIPLRAAFSPQGEFLVAAAEPGLNQFKLLLLNPVNGFELQTADLNEFPIGLGFAGNDFFILCVKSDTSIVYRYSTISRNLTEWAKVAGESPVDITSSNNFCYMATDQGLYQIYNDSQSPIPGKQISDRISSLPISDLAGNILYDGIYFSSGNSIYVCNGNIVSLVETLNGKQISKVEVLYNK